MGVKRSRVLFFLIFGSFKSVIYKQKRKLHLMIVDIFQPTGGVDGRAFDPCLKDTVSNPAEAGYCVTTVG